MGLYGCGQSGHFFGFMVLRFTPHLKAVKLNLIKSIKTTTMELETTRIQQTASLHNQVVAVLKRSLGWLPGQWVRVMKFEIEVNSETVRKCLIAFYNSETDDFNGAINQAMAYHNIKPGEMNVIALPNGMERERRGCIHINRDR